MLALRTIALHVSLIVISATFAAAQISGPDDPGAGLLPYSTEVGGAYESVDLATSNVNVRIPVRSKTGKIPFEFSFTGNFHPWIASILHGQQWNITAGLVPGPSGLLGGRLSSLGQNDTQCVNNIDYEQIIYGIVDGTGALHSVSPPGAIVHSNALCGQTSATVTANDGSGFSASITAALPLTYTLYDKSGDELTANYTTHAQTLTDPDSVTMQKTYTNWPLAGSYIDTLGQSAVSFSLGDPTGTPDNYTFTGGDGNTQTYRITYTPYTTATHFLCTSPPAVGEANQQTIYLPTTIEFLTTGETYTMKYEQTPTFPIGYTTGRLVQIDFPSGAYVKYSYSDSEGHNGIECHTGVVPTLTRTVNDNNGNTTVYTYVNTDVENGTDYTVTADFPYAHGNGQNSTIVYSFSDTFQTRVQYYQGSASGSALKTVLTCYNGKTTNCVQPSPPVQSPITQTDVYTSLNTSQSNHVKTTFDAYGDVTEVKSWDVGGTTVLSDVVTQYGSYNSSSHTCAQPISTPIGTSIYDRPCGVTTSGPNGQANQVGYTYNNTGHPIDTYNWVAGQQYLVSSATYTASTGVLATSTDAAGNVTQYNQGSPNAYQCNGILSTQTNYPTVQGVSLKSSQTWDCGGGVMDSSKDVNGNPYTYAYNDPHWRLTSYSNPDGGGQAMTYNTGSSLPWTVSVLSAMQTNQNTLQITTYDGLDRQITQEWADDVPSPSYVHTTYDLLGRASTVSNRCRTCSGSEPTYGLTTYTYDALNRVTKLTRPDNTSVNTTIRILVPKLPMKETARSRSLRSTRTTGLAA